MNFAKLVQGIVVGALFSGVLSAICAVYIALTSDTVDSFSLKAKDFWWLAMLLAGIFGLIVGGVLGGIVSELNLSLIKAGLCGLIITVVPAIFFHLLSEGKFDENHIRFGSFFIVIATLTGILVSYLQMSFFKSE